MSSVAAATSSFVVRLAAAGAIRDADEHDAVVLAQPLCDGHAQTAGTDHHCDRQIGAMTEWWRWPKGRGRVHGRFSHLEDSRVSGVPQLF